MNAAELETKEARRKFIGGSDIAALLGIAPPSWERNTPVALYYDKIEPPKDAPYQTRRQYLRRGKRWESVVAEALVSKLEDDGHTVDVVGGNRRFIDDEHDFFACEVDLELIIDHGPDVTNCEIKTVHPFKSGEWGEHDTDDAPDWVIAQAMWGLGITKRQRCLIMTLFGADEYGIYPIERDDVTIAVLRKRAHAFWVDNVLARVPPPPISTDDLALMFPKEGRDPALEVEGNAELLSRVLRLRAIQQNIKALKCEFDSVAFDIQRAMGRCAELTVRGKSAITWRSRRTSYLDQAALKAEQPLIHRKYMRSGTCRQFAIRPFEWTGAA